MAVYTQLISSYDDGETIYASLFTSEFNQIIAAFDKVSGHNHNGTTDGSGAPITTLYGNTVTLGRGTADVRLDFNAGTNDGVLIWKDTENHFMFHNSVLIDTPSLGNAAGDEVVQLEISGNNANNSILRVVEERDSATSTDWLSTHKRIEFAVDTTRMSYIAQNFNGDYGLEIGNSAGGGPDTVFSTSAQPWISMKKAAIGNGAGAVELYYGDNGTSSKKLETQVNGLIVTGSDQYTSIVFKQDQNGPHSIASDLCRIQTTWNEGGLSSSYLDFMIADDDLDGFRFRAKNYENGNSAVYEDFMTIKFDPSVTARDEGLVNIYGGIRQQGHQYNLFVRDDVAGSPALYVQQTASTGRVASFRFGSAAANGGTEILGVLHDKIQVTGGVTADYLDLTGGESTTTTGTVACTQIVLKDPTGDGDLGTDSCKIYTEEGIDNQSKLVIHCADDENDQIVLRLNTNTSSDVLVADSTGIVVTGYVGASRYSTTTTNNASNYFSRTNADLTLSAMYVQRLEDNGKIASFRKGNVLPNEGDEVLGVLSTGIDVTGTVTADAIKFTTDATDDAQIFTELTGTTTALVIQSKDDADDSIVLRSHNAGVGQVDVLVATKTGIDVTGTVTANSLAVQPSSGDASSSFTSVTGRSVLTVQSTFDGDEGDESAAIEIGAKSLAFLDLKTDANDDYDLRIYHSEPLNHSMINALNEDLYLKSGGTIFLQHGGANTKLETTSTGIDVTGTVTASEGVLIPEGKKLRLGSETDSAGLDIYESTDGDSLINQYGDGNLIVKGQNILLRNNSDQTLIATIANTAQLFHRNGDNEGLKLETTNSGIDVTGTVTADGVTLGNDERIKLGGDSTPNLEIYETAAGHGLIVQNGEGDLKIKGQNGFLQNDAGNALVAWDADHSELSWQGATGAGIKLETTEIGINVTGKVECKDTVAITTTGSGTDPSPDLDFINLHADAIGERLGQINYYGMNDESGSGSGQTKYVWTEVRTIDVTEDSEKAQHETWVKNGASHTRVLQVQPTGIEVTGAVKSTEGFYTDYKNHGDFPTTDSWYTIAICKGRDATATRQRASGEFVVVDNTDAAGHETTRFTASELFAQDAIISVSEYLSYSSTSINRFRIKSGDTFEGSALQVYASATTADLGVTLINDPYLQSNEGGWHLLDAPVIDSSDPSTGTGTDRTLGFTVGIDSRAWDWTNFTSKADTGFLNNPTGLTTTSGVSVGGNLDVTGAVTANSLTIDNGTSFTGATIDSATGASVLTVKSTFEGGTEWQNIAAIEVGGHDKAYIDLKKPDDDDTDLRLLHDGDGSLTAFTGDLLLQTTTSNSGGKVALVNGSNTRLETTDIGIDVTGTIAANSLVLTDTDSSDRTKPEIRLKKDTVNSDGEAIGQIVFGGYDKWEADRVFAEIVAVAVEMPTNEYQANNDAIKSALHFNLASGGVNTNKALETPACVIDTTGVHINSSTHDGTFGTNYFHIENTNLASTKNGGIKYHSGSEGDASNKTTKLISKPVTQDATIELPNVTGTAVVAAIAGGSINGGGGTVGAKTTWSESDFNANVNTTYLHYNAVDTADITVSPDFPDNGYGDYFKFVNASPQASDIIIDLDGYTGTGVSSYALTKSDGSLNVTVTTNSGSTNFASSIVVAPGGYVILTKVSYSVYMVEGIGYTYS